MNRVSIYYELNFLMHIIIIWYFPTAFFFFFFFLFFILFLSLVISLILCILIYFVWLFFFSLCWLWIQPVTQSVIFKKELNMVTESKVLYNLINALPLEQYMSYLAFWLPCLFIVKTFSHQWILTTYRRSL